MNIKERLKVSIKYTNVKNSLISFESHTIIHLKVIIQVYPCTICTTFTIITIIEPPVTINVFDMSLSFGKQFIIYPNITIRCPTNNNLLPLIFKITTKTLSPVHLLYFS